MGKNTNNGKKSYFSFSPKKITMNINITSSICDPTQMILTEKIKVDIVRPHSNIEVDNVATMWRIGQNWRWGGERSEDVRLPMNACWWNKKILLISRASIWEREGDVVVAWKSDSCAVVQLVPMEPNLVAYMSRKQSKRAGLLKVEI